MNLKIVLKKKEIVPIKLESDSDDCLIIDQTILPVAKGPFSAKMRGGLSISVTKSGYQKSIRRGYYHLGNVFGLLWFEVGALYAPLMSNLINRLIIIAGEDCAANLKFLHWIDQKVSLFRQKKISGCLTPQDLCLVTTMMVKSSKTRVSSWAKGVFYDGLNHPAVCHQVEDLYPGIRDLVLELDQVDRYKAYLSSLTSLYPLLSIRYAFMAHVKEEKSVVNLIWGHLLKMKNDEHTQLLYRWYQKEKSENRIYLILAHVYVCQPDWFEMVDVDESSGELMMSEWNHLINYGEIKIPKWMIDMHTQEGKKNGMNGKDFAEVGSQIENMWMPLCNPHWIKIYQDVKIVPHSPIDGETVSSSVKVMKTQSDSVKVTKIPITVKVTKIPITLKVSKSEHLIEKKVTHIDSFVESGVLTHEMLSIIKSPGVPRGQLITASYKPYVYLPRDLSKWVFKGPFPLKREARLKMLKRRYDTFKILGSSVINVELMKGEDQMLWVRYQNLATVNPSEWKTETKHDNMNDLDVEIIIRESLGFRQLSKLPVNEIEKILFDGDQPFYLTFLDAALLGCGDMGDHNTLISGGLPYLIDYDDSTTRPSFGNYYDVYRKTSIAQKKMFDKRVPTILEKILTRIAFYKENQSHLEKCLGTSLNKTLGEIESVYIKI